MKKIIAIVSALAVCAALFTACSGDKNTAETTAAPAETTSAATTTTAAATDAQEPETEDDGGELAETVSDNPLQPLVDAVTSVGEEWPMLMEVTDPQMITDYFMLDKDNANYKNMIIMQCPMSAIMTEIIIIEADDADAAKADLEKRQKKAQDVDAFYPADAELAAASIVGTEGNYAYFLLAKDAEASEKALADAIKAL